MIDYTNDKIIPYKGFDGVNGSKICVCHSGVDVMLKFPATVRQKNNSLHYSNGLISEYLGSKIFKALGIDSQEVELGSYNKNNKKYDVVACVDFTSDDSTFMNFMSLKNTLLESESNGKGTELTDLLDVIHEQQIIRRELVVDRLWDMFVVDSYIGNPDRHNGNWGFLINNNTKEVKLAPVFDCGASLYPLTSEETMKQILNNEGLINDRVYNSPNSAIKFNGQRINYHDFLTTTTNIDCINALDRFYKNFDQDKINDIIDNTPISDISKEFYKTMLSERKEKILDKAYALNFNQSKIR